jgi:Ser-tRNA(Ala) deacylase AlaX
MAARRLYFEDPALAAVETVVLDAGEEDGKPFVLLRETVFHPESGGQPADRGTIGGVEVLDVRERDGEVLHFVAGAVAAGPVLAKIDEARRFDLRQQHTAQHLLTALLAERHGRATTAFHLGETYTAIEVTGTVPSRAGLREFEEEVNGAIREDRPVTARWVSPGEMDTLPVRSRGLPGGHRGPVRLVSIEGIDLNTCGGTHVTRLGEIRMVHLLDAAPARGGARIRFLAGGRVLRHIALLTAREDELKARLANAPEEFARVIDGWLADRKLAERRVKRLEAELSERIAAELAAEPGPRLFRRLTVCSGEMLRAVAGRVLSIRPEVVVELVGEDPDTEATYFLVMAGPRGPADVSADGERLRASLGAKGGGRGRMYQGTRTGGGLDGDVRS